MMLWRLLHIVVLVALVLAAADVYKIKYESTLQAEKVAKLRGELRREQDAIANLRAEWSKLDRPDRLQELAQRHLTLKPVETRQFDTLDKLPAATGRPGAARHGRSDRRRDRDLGRPRSADGQRPRCGRSETAMTETSQSTALVPVAPVAAQPAAPAEPWRRRMLRTLLYGKADRHAKARARIGLAMIAFAVVYAIIAGRLWSTR